MTGAMTVRFHTGDLPSGTHYRDAVAVDTEALGLNLHRDRLCLVQLSGGDGTADIVQIKQGQREAPNLVRVLTDRALTKIFHYARFDVAILQRAFGAIAAPLFCTKIASRLTRTYTDRHGLKDIVKDLLDIELSKQQQSSDWAAENLSEAQLQYAASDVLHLHALKAEFERRLAREGRTELAAACFAFLPVRVQLDLLGWSEDDIFAH